MKPVRHLLFCAAITFIALISVSQNSYAQTDQGLQDAIGGGQGAVSNYLGNFSPEQIAQNISPDVLRDGLNELGIENLTGTLGGLGNVEDLLGSLSDIGGQLEAELAATITAELQNVLDPAQFQELIQNLGPEFIENLENIVPDLGDFLNDITNGLIESLFGDLAGILDGLFDLGDVFGGLGTGGISLGGGGTIPRGRGGIRESSALPTASPITPTCNAEIMIAMETRAWLEAQREVTQNANYIAKPDSVLEYSCFDQFLNVLAEQAENIFSENRDAWSETPAIITDQSMDAALQAVVGSANTPYITNNFGHTFVGGRAFADHNMAGVNGGDYTCDRMNLVWQEAKCMNFAMRDEDGFLTFSQHASDEVRDLAGECGGSVRYPGYTDAFIAQDPYRTAYATNVQTSFDAMRAYTGPVGSGAPNPPTCGGNDRAVETGLTIFDQGTNYDDTICVNPGCYYNRSQCVPL